MNGLILYDSDCGVCSRWVTLWEGVLSKRGFRIERLQAAWVAGSLKISREELTAHVRLLFPDGRHIQGPEVYRYAMRRIWWAFPFYLLSILPGLRSLFDTGYGVFAAHRYRLSKFCGLSGTSGASDRFDRSRSGGII
ncbi:MAG: DUF393 domain-containing protein [Bacteroidota bacterium]